MGAYSTGDYMADKDSDIDDENDTDDEELDDDDTMPDDDGTGDDDDEEDKPKPKAKKASSDDDDDSGDGKAAYKAPSEAEHRKLMRAHKRANKQAKEAREELKKLREERATKKTESNQEDLDARVEEARASASEEAAKPWKARVVKQAAKAAFLAEGLKGTPDKLIRLLDLDDIEVDEETDDIDGLEEQVLELKEEFPDLFTSKTDDEPERKVRNKASNAVDKGNKDKKHVAETKTSAQNIADLLVGAGRK